MERVRGACVEGCVEGGRGHHPPREPLGAIGRRAIGFGVDFVVLDQPGQAAAKAPLPMPAALASRVLAKTRGA